MWAHTSMYHVIPVAVLDGEAQLKDVPPHSLRVKTIRVLLQQLEQVVLHVFKHQVQLLFAPKRLAQLDDGLVPEQAQDLHLS
jgi:hypothetical protein